MTPISRDRSRFSPEAPAEPRARVLQAWARCPGSEHPSTQPGAVSPAARDPCCLRLTSGKGEILPFSLCICRRCLQSATGASKRSLSGMRECRRGPRGGTL